MPIYEYQCESCGHELEKLQKMSDAPLKDCPSCGEPRLKKKISAAAFRLKGGGWYETDFKSGDKKKNLAGESGSGSKAAGDTSAAGKSADTAAGSKTTGSKKSGETKADTTGKSAKG